VLQPPIQSGSGPFVPPYKLKMVLKLAHLISSSVVCSPIAEARTWQFAARPRSVAKSLQWVVVYSRYHLQVTEIARRQLLNTYRVEHIRIYIMIHRDRCLGRLTRPQARTQEAPGRSRMGVDYVERTSKSPAFDPHLPNLAINSFLVRRTAGPAWKLTFVSPESHSHCLSVRHGLPPCLVAPALLAYPAINHCNIFSSCHSHTVKNQCRIVTILRLALSPVWVEGQFLCQTDMKKRGTGRTYYY